MLVRPRAFPASRQYSRSTGVSVSSNDSVTSVPLPLGSNRYAPGVHRLPPRALDAEHELAAGLTGGDRAVRPVHRAALVAADVAPEPCPDRRASGTVEPFGLEGLRAELPGVGDVAHQPPDPFGRSLDMDGHGISHGMRLRAGGGAARSCGEGSAPACRPSKPPQGCLQLGEGIEANLGLGRLRPSRVDDPPGTPPQVHRDHSWPRGRGVRHCRPDPRRRRCGRPGRRARLPCGRRRRGRVSRLPTGQRWRSAPPAAPP